MVRFRAVLVTGAVLGVLGSGAAARVSAQQSANGKAPRAARPYRGLFGAENPIGENGRLIDLTVDLGGGYDDALGAGEGDASSTDPSAYKSSAYGGGGALLRLRRRVENRFDVTAAAAANSYRYVDLNDFQATSVTGTFDLQWQVTGRTRLGVAQSAHYSPYFSYALFPAAGVEDPGLGAAPSFNTRVARNDNLQLISGAQLSQELTRRLSFETSGSYSRIDFRQADSNRDTAHYSARAGVRYRLTNYSGLRLGYGFTQAVATDLAPGRRRLQTVDVGLDYSRALSFSRRSRLTFSSGTTAYSDDVRTRFVVVGTAQLTHQLSRTWGAGLTYARDLQMVGGFAQPYFADSLAFRLSGYWGSRLVPRLVLGATRGQFGVSADKSLNRETETYYGTPSLQLALTESMALQVSYFYYRYRFESGPAPLLDGLTNRHTRQGVRASLSVWLPVVR